MKYDFHGAIVETRSPDAAVAARWGATFASRPTAAGPADIRFTLELAEETPPAPAREPDFRQGDLLEYYVDGAAVTARFPRFGWLRLNLNTGEVGGRIRPAALTTQGVFEDVAAIGISPLLRRRGMFLLHAFAAARRAPQGHTIYGAARASSPPTAAQSDTSGEQAVLLVGEIGAGKTTTGLALLHAGWKLLSNDSPIVKDEGGVQVLAYPGLLSAYPETLARFPELRALMPETTAGERRKTLFAAESVYPGVWIDRARAGALVFPQIEARAEHALEPLAAPEALRRLLPNAVEQWDREMIPAHLALLRKLVEATPAFRLRLGPEVEAIPAVLASALG
jgi:hypothetical protein